MYSKRGWNYKKTLLSEYFFDFQGGMKPHTSLEIELYCGTIDYAFPGEVPDEINQYNELDKLRDDFPIFSENRFFLTVNHDHKTGLGYGNYRKHYPGDFGIRP